MKVILMSTTSFMTKLLKPIKSYGQRKMPLFLLSVVFLLAAAFITSCTKVPDKLGADLLPDSTLQVFYSDTADMVVYSAPIDTTRSDELVNSYLGSINDPVFGETKADFYTKIIQSTVGHDFGKNPRLDSLVLQLSFGSIYGDSTTNLHLHVYELKNDIFYDSVYYSNRTVPVFSTDYADYTFQPQNKNEAIVGKDTVHNVIRIRLSDLSDALGNKLLNADSTVLDSNELFMGYFKGLYLTTDRVNNDGALVSFNTNSPYSVLTIYYSNDDNDSLRYAYKISSSMARISHYEHDFSKGSQSFVNQVVNHDTALGRTQFYVQGLAGVKTIIRFPEVKNFARLGKIAVNEAKLILPGLEKDPYLGAPANLSLIHIASDSTYNTLYDESEGSDYFGGSYNAASNDYEFRITHYIQSLIQDTTQNDLGLLLFVNNGSIQPQRFIFGGPHPDNDTLVRAKLKLIYTKLK